MVLTIDRAPRWSDPCPILTPLPTVQSPRASEGAPAIPGQPREGARQIRPATPQLSGVKRSGRRRFANAIMAQPGDYRDITMTSRPLENSPPVRQTDEANRIRVGKKLQPEVASSRMFFCRCGFEATAPRRALAVKRHPASPAIARCLVGTPRVSRSKSGVLPTRLASAPA